MSEFYIGLCLGITTGFTITVMIAKALYERDHGKD